MIEITVAVIMVTGIVAAAYLNHISRLHVKAYRRSKKEMALLENLENGYIALLMEMVDDGSGNKMTPLAAKRRFRKILRKKGYETPGYNK
jgi:hypothetical protein